MSPLSVNFFQIYSRQGRVRGVLQEGLGQEVARRKVGQRRQREVHAIKTQGRMWRRWDLLILVKFSFLALISLTLQPKPKWYVNKKKLKGFKLLNVKIVLTHFVQFFLT
jgi:hypothetical protein